MSVSELISDLNATQVHLRRADWHNNGRATKRSLSVLLPPELRYLSEVICMSELVSEILEERVEIRDVEAPGFDELTATMRGWRDDQDLAELESQTTMEELSLGRGYIAVSQLNANDPTPVFTVESPYNMIHKVDPRTRDVVEALRKFGDVDSPQYVHYTPEGAQEYGMVGGRLVTNGPSQQYGDLLQGMVPVVPFVNRSRVGDRWGRPAAKRIWGLQEDMSRTLTDLAAACALLAVPQRAIMGIDANEQTDTEGKPIPAAKLWMARLLTLSDSNARIAEFAAAQLAQFTSTMVAYGRLASSMTGIPIVFFGVASEANPASGDAQRADMDRLNKRAERICRGQRKPWRLAYRIGARFSGVTDQAALRAIDVHFENPATTTITQRVSSAVGLAAVRRLPDAMFTPEYIMGLMGVSPEKVAAMDAQQTENVLDKILSQLPPEPPPAPAQPIAPAA